MAHGLQNLEDSIPRISLASDQVLVRNAIMEQTLQKRAKLSRPSSDDANTRWSDVNGLLHSEFAMLKSLRRSEKATALPHVEETANQVGESNSFENKPAVNSLSPTAGMIITKFNLDIRIYRSNTAALKRSFKIKEKIKTFGLVKNN